VHAFQLVQLIRDYFAASTHRTAPLLRPPRPATPTGASLSCPTLFFIIGLPIYSYSPTQHTVVHPKYTVSHGTVAIKPRLCAAHLHFRLVPQPSPSPFAPCTCVCVCVSSTSDSVTLSTCSAAHTSSRVHFRKFFVFFAQYKCPSCHHHVRSSHEQFGIFPKAA
jgi:hypothetical protein